MKILFLGTEYSFSLAKWIEDQDVWVDKRTEKITSEICENIKPEIIISYNYPYIISKDVIDRYRNRIINLHISYLPWNKGSDPNIWSIIDDTPKGVTIHLIDEGVDTGDIIYQKLVHIEDSMTLKTSYDLLHHEIQSLFKENWLSIKTFNFEPINQNPNDGSEHKKRDRPFFNEVLKKYNYSISIDKFKKEVLNFHEKNKNSS
jgi:methionyl-tRNA formyltransferase